MNSMGSSMVMMCPRRSRLIMSTKAASVVDFPAPGGARNEDQPAWAFRQHVVRIGGRPSFSIEVISYGICRIAMATQPRCLNTFPRNRERFWTPNEKSNSSSVSKRFFWCSVRMEYAIWSVSFGFKTVVDLGIAEFSIDPDLRPHTRRDMEVGGPLLDHLLKEHPEIDVLGRSTQRGVVRPRPGGGLSCGGGRLIHSVALYE